MKKVRTIIIDGIEIQTSLSAVEIADLVQKNQELKKQLEEYKRLGFKHLNDKCNKLENQQKKFIEYLEEKEKEFDILGDPKNAGACKGILRKYKSIIGVSHE